MRPSRGASHEGIEGLQQNIDRPPPPAGAVQRGGRRRRARRWLGGVPPRRSQANYRHLQRLQRIAEAAGARGHWRGCALRTRRRIGSLARMHRCMQIGRSRRISHPSENIVDRDAASLCLPAPPARVGLGARAAPARAGARAPDGGRRDVGGGRRGFPCARPAGGHERERGANGRAAERSRSARFQAARLRHDAPYGGRVQLGVRV